MKKIVWIAIFAVFAFFALAVPVKGARADSVSPVKARSAYLMDKRTGETLYGQRENDEFPIASMVKIMTALLTFEEIEKGSLRFDESITISDAAAGMGGSQMFLDRGLSYPVTDLLKGVIVVSANDACVALAERISGSEESFVEKMNDKAKELGMTRTVFVNATGLPKEGGHSTAHDVALMLRALTSHERYYDYSKIWLEEYKHPDGRITTLTNTNKFVRFYDECDGGKTGFTSEAKFCLAASATRGDTKLISVVIGADDSKTRFSESKRLLRYGFSNYKTEIVLKKGEAAFYAPLSRGAKNAAACGVLEDLSVLLKTGEKSDNIDIKAEFLPLRAPIEIGQTVGSCVLTANGKTVTVPIVALEKVGKATIGDSYQKILGEWT